VGLPTQAYLSCPTHSPIPTHFPIPLFPTVQGRTVPARILPGSIWRMRAGLPMMTSRAVQFFNGPGRREAASRVSHYCLFLTPLVEPTEHLPTDQIPFFVRSESFSSSIGRQEDGSGNNYRLTHGVIVAGGTSAVQVGGKRRIITIARARATQARRSQSRLRCRRWYSTPPILLGLTLHSWRIRVFDLHPMRRTAGAIQRA
jgi:hypothetical protein